MKIVEYLPWDSDLFKKKIGKYTIDSEKDKIEFKEVLDIAHKKGFECIYVFDPYNFIADVKITGTDITLVDTKINYHLPILSSTEILNSSNFSRIENTNEYTQLYELAFESGKYSRFKTDSHFSNQDFKRLYQKWIDNSINKKIADEVIGYFIENQMVGMITLQEKEGTVQIGLISVFPKFQGRGIGKELVKYAILYAVQKKAYFIEVSTQLLNKPACKFYEKIGFEPKELTNIYHIWY